MRASSLASRKKTWGSMPRPWSAPSAAPSATGASPGPHVEDDARRVVALRVARHELREVAQQLAGDVVHDRVAEVLEELAGGRLARRPTGP